MRRMHPGDAVTVVPEDGDHHLLTYRRYAITSRSVLVPQSPEGQAASWYVTLPSSWPPDQEVGPIPESRLLPGWKDEHGNWRTW